LTAGASADSESAPKPAARTATAWRSPIANRVPSGIVTIAELPMSRMRKKNQSVQLARGPSGLYAGRGARNADVLEDGEHGEEEPGLV
jgi:hypothetical protein